METQKVRIPTKDYPEEPLEIRTRTTSGRKSLLLDIGTHPLTVTPLRPPWRIVKTTSVRRSIREKIRSNVMRNMTRRRKRTNGRLS